MPTAHISEIVKIHSPGLRVTRTADVKILRGVWHKLRTLRPTGKVIESVSHRTIHLVDAWLKNGAPADLTVDKSSTTDEAPIYRVDLKAKRLQPVASTDEPGYYFKGVSQ